MGISLDNYDKVIMDVTLTSGDVDDGERDHCHQCPVALAIFRTMDENGIEPETMVPGVSHVYAHLEQNLSIKLMADMPRSFTSFIPAFDSSVNLEVADRQYWWQDLETSDVYHTPLTETLTFLRKPRGEILDRNMEVADDRVLRILPRSGAKAEDYKGLPFKED